MNFPVLALVLLLPVAVHGKDGPQPAVPREKDKAIELEPFKIHEKPIISFAVDIVVRTDPATGSVTRIFITRVLPRTDAERAGLREGDEIVSLDGVAVKGLDATVAAGSPLGRFLLGRDPGDSLKFGVVMRRTQECTLRAAVQENTRVGFAADFVVYVDPQTKQVGKVFISRVRPESDAEKADLQKGDEVLKFDELTVPGLDSALTPESPLGRLLVGRKPGTTLRLETAGLRTKEVTLKAQRGLPFATR
ncbi:MAG: hypothetical protein QG602_300 [Verrucomicrobiota bacterium]|nr:hypothetical protein [Verrucomicrobiota bacterium]